MGTGGGGMGTGGGGGGGGGMGTGGGSAADGDIVVGGFMTLPQFDGCNMNRKLTCNPADTQGRCNWKDGACVSVGTSDSTSNMDSASNSTSLPSECLLPRLFS